MSEPKTHIPRSFFRLGDPTDASFTLCGKFIHHVRCIGKNDIIDSATCRVCQRSDDRRQVENHLRECKEAGIDPDTMEPLKRKHA